MIQLHCAVSSVVELVAAAFVGGVATAYALGYLLIKVREHQEQSCTETFCTRHAHESELAAGELL